jgi:hypothetical protein
MQQVLDDGARRQILHWLAPRQFTTAYFEVKPRSTFHLLKARIAMLTVKTITVHKVLSAQLSVLQTI